MLAYRLLMHGLAKCRAPSLVNLVPTVAHYFCLALPAAFTQPGSRLLAERSSICSVDASYGTFGGGETETEEAPRKCSRVSAGMAFESDERASALASCRRAVEENADSFTGMLGRYVWSLNQHHGLAQQDVA